ncbi:cAMP-regulated phosphoprotein/endosulfine conserved region [Metschnikowia aff. pulcherrima]|uniref:mRNA stability protein n=2 Tax=Metschnikowia TaxID=27320 RepID=A0A4P6XT36_9ASCO|nr:cAMP-regulated phosphoprotein/endosulfine conserved region [Metschnikowia aff. pulcherrima]
MKSAQTQIRLINMSSDEDPLGPPRNEQGIDLSKLSPQELRIFKMYGKLPTKQQILSSKLQDKKYFDSGDYAMQKQLGGNKSGVSGVPLKHPNAEKVKEMYNRNSISASNLGILFNGKLGLLSESTMPEDEEKKAK